MEMLAALGLGAKGLFDYNRDNFKFDQDQRLEREALRLEMQVERFKLFREDVRDLVELTVGRMDIYHLVGALFLEFCIVLFCEGRVHASAPPFLLSLYLLSNACAFIYLLLAVWLSMHASVASHSFGVRLLTRFVRLPIPSQKQINQLRNTLKDYEQQGLANLLKLPFVDKKQQWKPMEHPHLQPQGQEQPQPQLEPSQAQLQRGASFPGTGSPSTPTNSNEGQLPASRSFTDLLRNRTPTGSRSPIRSFGVGAGTLSRSVSEISEGEPAVSFAAGAPTSASIASPALPSAPPSTPAAAGRLGEQPPRSPPAGRPQLGKKDTPLLPEDDEAPIGGEDLLSSTTGALPERHVQLFRQLQAKWQCYDAYCRVCMGLGVNQILQGLSYYAICHTLVENHTPTTGFGLVIMFQATAVALAVLDLAGLSTREIFAVQAIGTMPTFVAALSVTYAEREEHSGALDPEQRYGFAPAAFLCQALWLELWLRVARPSTSDQHTELPRRFRQVLFLDVFNDAGGCDPLEDLNPSRKAKAAAEQGKAQAEAAESLDSVVQAAADAAAQLNLVQCAIRRWKAAPDWALSSGQRQELDRLCHRMNTSGGSIQRELDLLPGKPRALESPLQRWDQLTPPDRQTEAFAGSLLGPFVHESGHQTSSFHYDVEGQRCLFDGSAESAKRQGFVLSLGAVSNLATDLERAEAKLVEARILRDRRVEERRRTGLAEDRKLLRLPTFLFPSSPAQPQAPAPESRPVGPVEGAFPNLIPLIRERRNSPLFLTVSPQEEDEETESEAGGAEASAGPSSTAPRPPTESQAPNGGVAPDTFASGVGEPVSFFYPDGAGIELQQVTPNGAAPSSSGGTMPQQAAAGTQRWGRKKAKDPTLVAMAGKHAVHFVPERLPWHVLSRMTRVLQMCWFAAGTMILLGELDLYKADFQHPEHKHCVAGQVAFQPVDVRWPHGRLFNPQGLFCGFGSPGELLVTSPFALYGTRMLSDSIAAPVSDAGSLPGLPAAAALLCGAGRGEGEGQALGQGPAGGGNASSGCFAAGPGDGGLRLWRFGAAPEGPDTALLRVEGAPWQLLTGAVMECSAVSGLLRSAAAPGQRCLMLVGWTGAMLPIAVRPLDGLEFSSSSAVLDVKPILDIPLDVKQGAAGLTALHLEPHSGRLWVLLADGRLESWDLIGFQSLGRWKPSWGAAPKDFRLSALCSDEARGLLAVGRSKSAGPALLRAASPVGPADFRLPSGAGGLLAEIV